MDKAQNGCFIDVLLWFDIIDSGRERHATKKLKMPLLPPGTLLEVFRDSDYETISHYCMNYDGTVEVRFENAVFLEVDISFLEMEGFEVSK